MIDLSIIVPTMNTSSDNHQDVKIRYARNHCLQSLLETTPEEIQIVVASNNGDPAHIELIDSPRIKRINIWEQGQCKAVNVAVATTNTEWIMITNDDMVYPPGWVDFMFWEITDQQCVSLILVEPEDGAPTFIKQFCGGAGGDFDKQKFVDFVDGYHKENANKSVGLRTGFNFPLLIKRELWNLIGGYDVNYDPWGSNSDSDLEYKIKLAGIQPYQNDYCLVYHMSQTSGTFTPKNREYWQKNWDYFIEKWGFPRTDDGIWEASFTIPYDKLKYRPKWAVIPEVDSTK